MRVFSRMVCIGVLSTHFRAMRSVGGRRRRVTIRCRDGDGACVITVLETLVGLASSCWFQFGSKKVVVRKHDKEGPLNGAVLH